VAYAKGVVPLLPPLVLAAFWLRESTMLTSEWKFEGRDGSRDKRGVNPIPPWRRSISGDVERRARLVIVGGAGVDERAVSRGSKEVARRFGGSIVVVASEVGSGWELEMVLDLCL
jgi:hypothetical protein